MGKGNRFRKKIELQLTSMQVMQIQHIWVLLCVRMGFNDSIGRKIVVSVNFRIVQLGNIRVVVSDGRLTPLECILGFPIAFSLIM